MRKALSVSDLREHVKLAKLLVVANAALFGLTAVELLWSWSSRSDLARRDLAIINAMFGLGLAFCIRLLIRNRRQLESSAQYLPGVPVSTFK